MIFLGTTFCAAEDTLDSTPTNLLGINSITLQKGVFDDLYITRKVELDHSGHLTGWDFDTLLLFFPASV